MEFKINVDTREEQKEMERKALAAFRQSATSSISNHFANRSHYSDLDKKVIKVKGPGTFEIEERIDKFFGDPKTIQQMDNFFDENFTRIMEETMTKALQHHCNRLVFSRARNKAKEPKVSVPQNLQQFMEFYLEEKYSQVKNTGFNWSTFLDIAWSYVESKAKWKLTRLTEAELLTMEENCKSLARVTTESALSLRY